MSSKSPANRSTFGSSSHSSGTASTEKEFEPVRKKFTFANGVPVFPVSKRSGTYKRKASKMLLFFLYIWLIADLFAEIVFSLRIARAKT